MPYSGAADEKLPDHIKKLDESSRTKWVGAFNGAYAQCVKENKDDCEGRSFRIANASVKKSWLKENKNYGEVLAHMPGPMSWEDLELQHEIAEDQNDLQNIWWDFRIITDSIMYDGALSQEQKRTMLATAASGYAARVADVTEGSDDEAKGKSLKALVSDAWHRIVGRKQKQPFTIYKDLSGQLRFFAWASNNFRDRDNPPEIISAKAHEEFVTYLDSGGSMPELWLWHTKGTRWGVADMVDFADGFLLVSGTIDKGCEGIAETVSKMKGLGVSHGFRTIDYDKANGIINQYRSFEISPLPRFAAANAFTSLEVLQKELTEMMNPLKKAFLAKTLGEARANELEKQTEGMGKALTDLGVESKEAKPAAAKPGEEKAKAGAAVAEPPAPAKAPGEMTAAEITAHIEDIVAKSPAIKALAELVGESIGPVAQVLPKIAKTFADQDAAIKELKKSDDEKFAAWFKTDRKPYRASADEKTKLDDAEAAKAKEKNAPSTSWFKDMVSSGMPGGAPK